MKKMNIDQMAKVNGGIDWCAVSVGVAGGGGILLGLGFALAGPFAVAAYASFSAYALYCELSD